MSSVRGLASKPVATGEGAKGGQASKAGTAPKAAGEGGTAQGGPAVQSRPDRPKIVLTRDDFGEAARDPFQGFLPLDDDVPGEVRTFARRGRDVKMAGYSFEDLSLIGIVRTGRKNVRPRALFVANNGKSKTILQGEHFSRAEVLLASVNRDYVEIEVVDEEQATRMNWPVGERRAIYLKNE